jgi:hypothetical protein
MPSYRQCTAPPPPWNGADSFRETTLICIDDPAYREALRQVGRMIYDMAIEDDPVPRRRVDHARRAARRPGRAALHRGVLRLDGRVGRGPLALGCTPRPFRRPAGPPRRRSGCHWRGQAVTDRHPAAGKGGEVIVFKEA